MANVKRANTSGLTKSGAAIADVPDAPSIGTATAVDSSSATVTYTAATTGGTATTFTATSTPGSLTGTGSSPITVAGLTAETSYTFTVRASNSTGNSPFSSASNSITTPSPISFDSIATVNVGAGGTGTISFTSIPSTYKHLQLRLIARTDRSGNPSANMVVRFNSDTATNYNGHALNAYVSAATASSSLTATSIGFNRITGATAGANIFGTSVIDIIDYANTNKYKTAKGIGGIDTDTTNSEVYFESGLWRSTSAINRIDITSVAGTVNFVQYSHFALYGIKG